MFVHIFALYVGVGGGGAQNDSPMQLVRYSGLTDNDRFMGGIAMSLHVLLLLSSIGILLRRRGGVGTWQQHKVGTVSSLSLYAKVSGLLGTDRSS